MSAKRKRVVILMKDEVQTVDQLKKCVRGKKLTDDYGVGTPTICDIKKNSESILKYVSHL